MRNEQQDLAKLADAFFENLFISPEEYGGIGVDAKRPFGNSDVEGDILEIIGEEPCWRQDDEFVHSEEQRQYARTLYHEKLIPYLRQRWAELNAGQDSATPTT